MPFSDLPEEDLTFAGMGTVAAHHGCYGYYANPFFARTRSDEGSGASEARVRSDTTMIGAGGLHRLFNWEAERNAAGPRGGQLEALAGLRVTDLRAEINGRRGLPALDDVKTWVDPSVGLQGRIELPERWEAFAEGDIGGFHVASDLA
jgi:hypothetical protein